MPSPLDQITRILTPRNYIDTPVEKQPYEKPWRGEFSGKAALVAFPTSVEQLSDIIKICNEHRIPIVPQGGNTGLVGGSTPDMSGKEIIISLSRMNKVRAIDPLDFTVTVEAGCILATLKEKLEAQQLFFPLSMASEGSAQVGGFVSTNAGGTAVLRYGNTRELVLGVEAVLPDGSIFNGLRALRKDNTGYDLKQLLIGAEGTLGIITAATLKLFPLPVHRETAFLPVENLENALELLRVVKMIAGDSLIAFELLPAFAIKLVEKHIPNCSNPLSTLSPYAILVELTSANPQDDLRGKLEQALEEGFNAKLLTDGVIAESGTQRENIWRLRENITEAEKQEGAMVNFDIAVPVSKFSAFVTEALQACEKLVPGIRTLPFGHMGDGNVHFNLLQPEGMNAQEFLARKAEIKDTVYAITHSFNGSISAEHGIGRERKKELLAYKSATEIALMQTIKKAIDPNNIMNPGRVIG